jgi:hypothetical protein
MFKKLFNRIKKTNKPNRRERWSDIISRYHHLTDGEFIDEILKNYHPPKRKVK